MSLKQYAAVIIMAISSAQATGMEQVLVESSQVRITSQDFEAEMERIPLEHRTEVLASKSRIAKLLENLIINKTLAAQARSAGIDREPMMAKQMELAVERLLGQEQVNRAIKTVTVPNFDLLARELYQTGIENYTLPAKVHASHILVDTKNRTSDEALQRIRQVREQVIGGKKFDELALEYSDDPSAKGNKGDLGFFEEGKMVKPFTDAAFALVAPGDISEPVKTIFGYHIILLHEKQPKKVRPFEEVKEMVIQTNRDKYLKEYRSKLLGGILSDPSLKLNEEVVNGYLTTLDFKAGDIKPGDVKPSEIIKPEAAKP